jgi:hypothetical protein
MDFAAYTARLYPTESRCCADGSANGKSSPSTVVTAVAEDAKVAPWTAAS